jgi:hypothetical protein
MKLTKMKASLYRQLYNVCLLWKRAILSHQTNCTIHYTPYRSKISEYLICIVISGKSLYINDLESARCNSTDIRKFAKEAKEIGIQYIGLCCGNSASYFRELAETYGRTTPASKYSPDMTMNSIFGEEQNVVNPRVKKLMDFTLGYRK